MRYTNTFSGQNEDFLKYEPGSVYSNHRSCKGYVVILTYLKHALQYFTSRTLIIFGLRKTTWSKISRNWITCVYAILRAWGDHYSQTLFELRSDGKVRLIWSLETMARPSRHFAWRCLQFDTVRTLRQDVGVQDIRIRNKMSQFEVLKIKSNTQRTCSQRGNRLLRIWNVRGSNLCLDSD